MKLHYHPAYAWNLIDCAIREGLMEDPQDRYPAGGYWAKELADSRPWIGPRNLHIALEMFVLAEQVLMPGLDVPNWGVLGKEGYMDWTPVRPRRDAIWLLNEIVNLEPLIIKGLQASKVSAPGRLFRHAIDSLKRVAQRETVRKELFSFSERKGNETVEIGVPRRLLRDHGKKEALRMVVHDALHGSESEEAARAAMLVKREFNFLRDSSSLVAQGVTAVSPIPGPRAGSAIAKGANEKTTVVVGLYFQNIRFPRPRTLTEALKLKENRNLSEWTRKVSSWSDKLAREELHPEDIRREIADANRYFKGASFLSHVVPWWAHLLLLPMEFMALFHAVPGALEIVPVAIHAVGGLAELTSRDNLSPNRPLYRWVMAPQA